MSGIRITLALIAAGALLLAPQAGADSHDDAFIDTLNILGVGTQYTDASRIHVAHEVCVAYDQGFGDSEMFATVAQNTGLSPFQAAEFVGAAAAAYRPQYDGYVPGTRVTRLLLIAARNTGAGIGVWINPAAAALS